MEEKEIWDELNHFFSVKNNMSINEIIWNNSSTLIFGITLQELYIWQSDLNDFNTFG